MITFQNGGGESWFDWCVCTFKRVTQLPCKGCVAHGALCSRTKQCRVSSIMSEFLHLRVVLLLRTDRALAELPHNIFAECLPCQSARSISLLPRPHSFFEHL